MQSTQIYDATNLNALKYFEVLVAIDDIYITR